MLALELIFKANVKFHMNQLAYEIQDKLFSQALIYPTIKQDFKRLYLICM